MEEQRNKKNKLLIFVNIVALLLVVSLGYLYVHEKQTNLSLQNKQDIIIKEKTSLQNELDQMMSEYENLKIESEDLSQQLEKNKEQIRLLQKKVAAAQNDQKQLANLKLELASLKNTMRGLVYTIDSLNLLNSNLIKENTAITETLNLQLQTNKALSQKNDSLSTQVGVAARLKLNNIIGTGYRIRSDNSLKEMTKAKKTDKIRVCFTVEENPLAQLGDRSVYLRLIAPGGKVLSISQDDSSVFSYDGIEGLFSSKSNFNYTGKSARSCLDWKKNADFKVGKYNIELIIDDYSAGKGNFVLN